MSREPVMLEWRRRTAPSGTRVYLRLVVDLMHACWNRGDLHRSVTRLTCTA